ncbi:MAG: PAS domain S-box protein, partial [bacterium]|nr:PAS domain S-box protein [bacterium]
NANIWLNVLDENANVVVWNKAAEQISGYTREEVFGESNIWEWFYPDDEYRNEIISKAASIMSGQTVEDLETIITCKDGSAKTMSWHSRYLLDKEKKLLDQLPLDWISPNANGQKRNLPIPGYSWTPFLSSPPFPWP